MLSSKVPGADGAPVPGEDFSFVGRFGTLGSSGRPFKVRPRHNRARVPIRGALAQAAAAEG